MKPLRVAQSANYLTTGDVEHHLGTSRKMLSEMANRSIVEPFGVSDAENTDRRWTLAQANTLLHVPEFRRNGYSLDEVAHVTSAGHQNFCDTLAALHMKEFRQARRALKAVSRYRSEQQASKQTEGAQGLYVRYIPQRYFALLPLIDEEEFLGNPKFIQLTLQLMGFSQIVGWAPVAITGALCNSGTKRNTHYAFVELAAQPDPKLTPKSDTDAGCYQVFAGDSLSISCNGNCEECVRFGRNATDREKFFWTARDRIVSRSFKDLSILSDVRNAYPTGPWSDIAKGTTGKVAAGRTAGAERAAAGRAAAGSVTAERMAERVAAAGSVAAAKRAAAGSVATEGNGELRAKAQTASRTASELYAATPRLMPQQISLPAGVTACVMPAGVYLCQRYGETTAKSAIERTLGLVNALPKKELTPTYERDAQIKLSEQMQPVAENEGLRLEQAWLPQEIGDPQLKGYFQQIELGDIGAMNMQVLTNTALATKGGLCVICEELPPSNTNDAPSFETQVLIEQPPPAGLNGAESVDGGGF